MFKKADISMGFVFLVVVILFFSGWLITGAQRECNSNGDCVSNEYCGSDYSCHQYPEVRKTIVSNQGLLLPALIIGVSLIAAAFIFSQRKESGAGTRRMKKKADEKEPEPMYKNSDDLDPYGEDFDPNRS